MTGGEVLLAPVYGTIGPGPEARYHEEVVGIPLDEPGQPTNDGPAMPAPVIGEVWVLGESGYPGRGAGGCFGEGDAEEGGVGDHPDLFGHGSHLR